MDSTLSNSLLESDSPSHDSTSKRSDYLEDDLLCETGVPPELCSIRQGTSSIWAAMSNTVGLMFGMGMLSIPYALQQGGLLGLSLLVLFGSIMCYTAYLLGRCLGMDSKITTYQDIGAAAFGFKGRAVLTTLLYVEVFSCLVGFAISLGDNLAQLFPNAELRLSFIHLEPSELLLLMSMVVVLPSICVRDLSYVSYFSFVGMVASITVVGAVAWAGVIDGVGFSQSVQLLQVGNLPLVIGLYAFCYSGHVIIPSIYSSMKDPQYFSLVLIVSFTVATATYGGLALMGAFMFGEHTEEQITLNIPTYLPVAALALWTSVINPLTKFPIGIAPVAKELESLLPFPVDSLPHVMCGSLIRISILVMMVTFAIMVPFFGYVISFIGSAISVSMSIIIPCSLYLKLFYNSLTAMEIRVNGLLIIFGIIVAILGTEASVEGLIQKLRRIL